jgi:hypothetical protein
MSATVRPPLDFTVTREDWCRYDLTDNSILKVKLILTRIHKNQSNYSADFKHIVVVLTNERGNPDTRSYTHEELQTNVTSEIRYTTVSQDWNEYVADDGTRLRLQPILMRVAKTSKFDSRGMPQYLVDLQGTIDVKPPTPSD